MNTHRENTPVVQDPPHTVVYGPRAEVAEGRLVYAREVRPAPRQVRVVCPREGRVIPREVRVHVRPAPSHLPVGRGSVDRRLVLKSAA